MTFSYDNPFRARTAEQHRELPTFLRTFGPGMLELLPDALWDRLFVLRSAPGGGKTSLLRLMTFESLSNVHSRRADLPVLAAQLQAIDAIDASGPRHVGILVSLDRDYKSLVDVGIPVEASVRLFTRLLDARIMLAIVKAALLVSRAPRANSSAVRFHPTGTDDGTEDALERLGGSTGAGIVEASKRAEDDVLRLLEIAAPSQLA